MNAFDEMKKEILAKAPFVSALPVWTRLKLWITKPGLHESTVSWETEKGKFSQSAVQVVYRDKFYTLYFGKLK